MGPQTNNKAEISTVMAGIRAVRNSKELCLYSDSKWCVDILTICGHIIAEGGWRKAKSLCLITIYGRKYTSFWSVGRRHCR